MLCNFINLICLNDVDVTDSPADKVHATARPWGQQLSRYVDDGIHYFFLLFPDPIPSENLDLFASEVMHHFT